MKYLVLSDIHANLEALDAALRAAGGYDQALVLGDLVGYGADPNAVIERVRDLRIAAVIRGNHDKVATGLEGVDAFNLTAREAIEWTGSVLTRDNAAWLAAVPAGPIAIDETIEICHGTPYDEDMYVFDDLDALRAIRSARRTVCLFGHTHVPAVFRLSDGAAQETGTPGSGVIELIGPGRVPRFVVDVEAHARYLVNCGAIGQPRDGDPRAGFGLVDTEARTVAIVRVNYDVAAAQAKILKAGLPEILAKRLSLGR